MQLPVLVDRKGVQRSFDVHVWIYGGPNKRKRQYWMGEAGALQHPRPGSFINTFGLRVGGCIGICQNSTGQLMIECHTPAYPCSAVESTADDQRRGRRFPYAGRLFGSGATAAVQHLCPVRANSITSMSEAPASTEAVAGLSRPEQSLAAGPENATGEGHLGLPALRMATAGLGLLSAPPAATEASGWIPAQGGDRGGGKTGVQAGGGEGLGALPEAQSSPVQPSAVVAVPAASVPATTAAAGDRMAGHHRQVRLPLP